MVHKMVHKPRHSLSAAFCRNVKHTGRSARVERHGDGNGLMLSITPGGSKHWVQRITIRGRRRALGLGSYPAVSLADARQVALKNRTVARAGGDPLRGDVPTFRTAAEDVIDLRSAAWKPGSKSAAQWRASLETYAFPVIGDMRVDKISSADVLAVVRPVWNKKRETAQRVRQRISTILLWCVAQGHRTGDPAGKAILQALPAGTGRVRQHYRALPYQDVPAALRRIRDTGAWIGTKLALEYLILTACRSGEVRGARWDEIDLDRRLWTVPAERMKAKTAHRVPLSGRCVELLAEARAVPEIPTLEYLAGTPLVFPSVRGRVLSDNTLSKLCREHRLGTVPHGFRSSFRDWASEQTTTAHAVMEAALAHTVPSAVERAYARSDLLDKRRDLMAQWAAFVVPPQ